MVYIAFLTTSYDPMIHTSYTIGILAIQLAGETIPA